MKTKQKFRFVEPKVIMAAVVALIFIVIGIFSIGLITNTQTDVLTGYSGRFIIENPDIDQVCDTNQYGLTGITIIQVMNDGSSVTIENANYSYLRDIITVDEAVIWG